MLESLFRPFLNHQNRYAVWERKHLLSKLEEVIAASPSAALSNSKGKGEGDGDFLGTIQGISESIPKLFLLGEKALERCLKFTHGAESQPLTDILNVKKTTPVSHVTLVSRRSFFSLFLLFTLFTLFNVNFLVDVLRYLVLPFFFFTVESGCVW